MFQKYLESPDGGRRELQSEKQSASEVFRIYLLPIKEVSVFYLISIYIIRVAVLSTIPEKKIYDKVRTFWRYSPISLPKREEDIKEKFNPFNETLVNDKESVEGSEFELFRDMDYSNSDPDYVIAPSIDRLFSINDLKVLQNGAFVKKLLRACYTFVIP